MSTLPVSKFLTLARAVFGRDTGWKTEFAAGIGVNRRTVERWCAGESPVPDYAIDALLDIAERRRNELDAVNAS